MVVELCVCDEIKYVYDKSIPTYKCMFRMCVFIYTPLITIVWCSKKFVKRINDKVFAV